MQVLDGGLRGPCHARTRIERRTRSYTGRPSTDSSQPSLRRRGDVRQTTGAYRGLATARSSRIPRFPAQPLLGSKLPSRPASPPVTRTRGLFSLDDPPPRRFHKSRPQRFWGGIPGGHRGPMPHLCHKSRHQRTTRDISPRRTASTHLRSNFNSHTTLDRPRPRLYWVPPSPLFPAPPNLGSCPARGAGSTPAVRIGITSSRSVGLRLNSRTLAPLGAGWSDWIYLS
jgi:hypothetical protein